MLTILSGCGGTATYEVSGEVLLDGEPVSEGQILFSDVEGIAGTAFSPIVDGHYAVETAAGKKQVRITALRETGRMKEEGMGMIVPETVELIPPRYNTRTELSIEVTEAGRNEFGFELSSQ